MDSFEINKIVAAILLVALLIIGIGKLSDIIFYVDKPETPGYVVEVEQVSTNSSETNLDLTEEKIDITALMAMGDITTGEKVFKKCAYHEVDGYTFIWTEKEQYLISRKEIGDYVVIPYDAAIQITLKKVT